MLWPRVLLRQALLPTRKRCSPVGPADIDHGSLERLPIESAQAHAFEVAAEQFAEAAALAQPGPGGEFEGRGGHAAHERALLGPLRPACVGSHDILTRLSRNTMSAARQNVPEELLPCRGREGIGASAARRQAAMPECAVAESQCLANATVRGTSARALERSAAWLRVGSGCVGMKQKG